MRCGTTSLGPLGRYDAAYRILQNRSCNHPAFGGHFCKPRGTDKQCANTLRSGAGIVTKMRGLPDAGGP